ncbi:MAG TPA: tetratricopeptide repeat protein [Pyrinomonadaceae bacterium]|nr:tetratricopeptide repeat protein [Pyrinomonadaceae bacterium]
MSDPRRPLWLAIAVLLFAYPALAQRDRDNYTSGITYEVSGEVRVPEGGPPARNINVRLERFSGGVIDQMTTDSRGKFRFTSLQRGYYTVFVDAPGYRRVQQQADLQVVVKLYLVFELVPDKLDIMSLDTPVLDARIPREAQDEFTKGRSAFLDERVKEAVPHLKRAVELYPDFFEAHFLLGTAYVNDLRWQDAETALRRALEIKPESAPVLFSLGEVYRRQKRYADAEKLLEDGLKLDENSWRGHFTLARVYWDKAEVLKAAPHVGRTLQLRADFADAHLLAGNIFVRLNLLDRAVVEYEEYLRLAPKGEAAEQTRLLTQKIKQALAEKKK